MAWPLSKLTLNIRDLTTQVDFYTKLGLVVVRDESATKSEVAMGVGTDEILVLKELKHGKDRPAHSAGLYHFAILLPDETELGSFLLHAINNIGLEGASDHLVSQALYLHDPEGNGIEVYADRPRAEWQTEDEMIVMGTKHLNAERLLDLAGDFTSFSAGTKLGHVHLNVSDLAASTKFYQELGMDLVAEIPYQANFLSWDGYHHHIGINTWEGAGGELTQPDTYGIASFEIISDKLAAGDKTDPNGITIKINPN